MNDAKYIGLDVHQATISAAVLDSDGRLIMESILETKAATVLQFIHGLHGSLHITFEEGTCAAWLHALLQPHVTRVVVCDPRKNALLKSGNENDRIDARKLADLLRSGLLSPVYHAENGIRTLKELARSYLAVTQDLTRVMGRLKALYRSWAIPCAGERVYSPPSAEVAGPGQRTRCAPPGGVLLPANRCAAGTASGSEARLSARKPKASRHRVAAPDSIDRSDSNGIVGCPDSNATSFPDQATALGLQRPWSEDLQQRRISHGGGADSTNEETRLDPRAQPQPQS